MSREVSRESWLREIVNPRRLGLPLEQVVAYWDGVDQAMFALDRLLGVGGLADRVHEYELRAAREPLEGAAAKALRDELLDRGDALVGVDLVGCANLDDETDVGAESGERVTGHALIIQPAVDNASPTALRDAAAAARDASGGRA